MYLPDEMVNIKNTEEDSYTTNFMKNTALKSADSTQLKFLYIRIISSNNSVKIQVITYNRFENNINDTGKINTRDRKTVGYKKPKNTR